MTDASDRLKANAHIVSGVMGWLLVGALSFALVGRRAERIDLAASAPADTLFYIETRDLGESLGAMTSARAFRDAAQTVPDLSALDGMQVAVAVTGFEASEERLNEDASEAAFRPIFVAIAETPFWGWQTRSFTENKLGAFVRGLYGEDTKSETAPYDGGLKFAWRAADGRSAFAFVRASRIFFTNDETALAKCLAVERREEDSLAGNNAIRALRSANGNAVGLGYLSPDGVAQLSAVAGISAAVMFSDNELARSFVARVLPQVVRGTVKDVSWVASKSESGIEDRFEFTMSAAAARALAASAKTGDGESSEIDAFVSEDAQTVTRYDFADSDVAWKTVLEITASATDSFSGKMLEQFAGGLLGSYGVADPALFLKSVRGPMLTARFDADGEESVAVVTHKNAEDLKRGLIGFDFKKPAQGRFGAEVWTSDDGDVAVAFLSGRAVMGNAERVLKCLEAREQGRDLSRRALYESFAGARAATVTLGREDEAAERVIETLSGKRDVNMKISTNFLTETRFTDRGVERRTVSPFGFLGTIVGQFARR